MMMEWWNMDNHNSNVDELRERLINALDGANKERALFALRDAIVFVMSQTCIECRRKIVRELKANLPAMLNVAGQIAASRRPTCH
jgi:hypothetical protein